jgi:hypothetical protein
MPLPRKKDEGGTGAPVLNILSAHVKLFDVEEYTEPYTVARKSDGVQFTLDPGFKCTVEVIDDGRDGSDSEAGARFFETFKYKQESDTGEWFNKENSKLGQLTNVVKPGCFEDDSIPELAAEDLEDFEMRCRIKPKKNPNTGTVIGSTIDWETMEPLRKKPGAKPAAKEKVAAAPAEEEDAEVNFEDIPW